MSSLFATLLNSTSALQVYGRAFTVIQNNITNANTPGYVKQDQVLVSMRFEPSAGITGGVALGPMQTSRSVYLEQAVRDQTGLLGQAQQALSDLGQTEPLFDVSGAAGVPGAMNNFFNGFSQLSVNPNDQVSRQNIIDAAGQVAEAFRQNAVGIQSGAGNVNNEIGDAVLTINDLAARIAGINKLYRSNLQASQDAGLDAQFYSALESLSEVADFSVIKSSDGSLSVFLGGQTPLVIGDRAYPISADFTAAQTVIRDAAGKDISAQLQGRGGSLGAMLTAKNVTLPGYLASLDGVAKAFADSVNAALALGVDRNGAAPIVNLFTYNAALGAAYTMAITNITPDEIAAATAAAPGGNGNALASAQLAQAPIIGGFTFTQAYGNLAGRVGRDVADARRDFNAERDLVDQAKLRRAEVSAVSLDEEAAKLLQFQQAYQAVGKLVGVLNSLTDSILNILR